MSGRQAFSRSRAAYHQGNPPHPPSPTQRARPASDTVTHTLARAPAGILTLEHTLCFPFTRPPAAKGEGRVPSTPPSHPKTGTLHI